MSWTENTSTGAAKSWTGVAMSSDGSRQTAVVNSGNIWTSSNSGAIWNENTSTGATKQWRDLAMTSNGQYQTAVVNNGNIWNFYNSS